MNLYQTGNVRIGDWASDQTLRKSAVQSCQQGLQRVERAGTFREDQLGTYANACEYLNQATQSLAGYSVFGDRRYLNPQVRQHSGKGPSFLRDFSVHGTIGYRGACQTLTRRDPYCEGLHQAVQGIELIDESFVLDDASVFDKVLAFTPQVKVQHDQFRSDNRNRPPYEIRVDLTKVTRVDSLEPPLIQRTAAEVQEFLTDQGLTEPGYGNLYQHDYRTTPVYVFDAAVQSVALVDAETGQAIMDLPLRPHLSAPDPALLRPLEKILEKAPSEPYGPDIVGLQLGMRFEDADAIIRQHMDVGTVKYADRKWFAEAAFGQVKPFTSGILYESADRRERIVLYDETPATKGTVLAIVRTVAWPKGQVTPTDLTSSLTSKYGAPDQSTGRALLWGGMENLCNRDRFYFGNKSGVWRNEDGTEDDWSLRGVVSDPPTPEDMHRFDPKPDCDVGLMAGFNPSSQSDWDELYIRVYDKGAYSRQFLQSQEILKSGTSSGGQQEGDTKVGNDKIKL